MLSYPDGVIIVAGQQTNWDLLSDLDVEIYISTVLHYIRRCIENVTIRKDIRIFPNRKPWMT